MSTDPKSVVMDWTNAVNRHDPDAAAAYVSDDCVFTNVGTGGHAEGRSAVREEFAALHARWSDVHVETINILVDGGRFTKEWTMTGVHSGDLPGLRQPVAASASAAPESDRSATARSSSSPSTGTWPSSSPRSAPCRQPDPEHQLATPRRRPHQQQPVRRGDHSPRQPVRPRDNPHIPAWT